MGKDAGGGKMKRVALIAQVVGVSVIIFILDFLFVPPNDGSILIGLLFWAGVGQGVIALAAAADLSGGKWIKEIRPFLMEYYPLLLLFPIAFLIFARHISVYAWAAKPGVWLSPLFFIVRNAAILLLPFIAAHFYVRRAKQESPKTRQWAVLYLLFFVIGQSFMAFDIVMTFEYPWVNTLFGGYFFVESLYGGVAFSAILAGVLAYRNAARFKPAFNDFTSMIMGFALLWAGLFYSQYLVTWYGNLPEEVSFIERRLSMPLGNEMGIYILAVLFLIPFLALVSRKVKSMIPAVWVIGVLVFSGLIVERLIYLLPVAGLSIIGVLLSLVLLGFPFIYLLSRQNLNLET